MAAEMAAEIASISSLREAVRGKRCSSKVLECAFCGRFNSQCIDVHSIVYSPFLMYSAAATACTFSIGQIEENGKGH